jgi:phage tail-like protein
MANGDPYVGYNFRVEIEGIIEAAFRDVSGIESSIDVTEHREGGAPTPRKFPGLVKYTNITLRHGLTADRRLYDWHRAWATGDAAAQRHDGSIVLQGRDGQEVVRWNFRNAWPSRWMGPTLNAESSDLAIEELELAHEGLERA